MNPSRAFIVRPVGTALLMAAIMLAGLLALRFLPVARIKRHDLQLRLGQRFLDEWRQKRRWALDGPSPFESVLSM